MSHSPRYAPRRISDTRSGRRARGVLGALLPARSGRVRRRAGLLALLLAAVLALTGCVDVQLKATVHADGTISGTARIGIAKSLATLGGGSTSSALDELKSQNPCEFGGKAGTTTKNFDDGTYVGIDCSFSGVTLAQFNSDEDGPKLAKVGDTFQLTGSLNLLKSLADGTGGLVPSAGATGGSPAPTALPTLPSDLSSLLPSGFPTDLSSLLPSGFPTDLSSLLPSDLASLLPSGLPSDLTSLLPSGLPTDLTSLLPSGLPGAASGLPGLDPSTLLKSAKINFEFTFPGKVKSSRGKVSGNTVVFTPDSTGNIDFQTVASAKSSGGVAGLGSTAWIGLVVLILLVAALLGLLVRRRRRGQAGQAAMAGGYPGPQQPAGYQPGYGQQYPDQNQYRQGQYPDQNQYPQGQYPGQTQPYPPAQQYPPTQDYQPPQQYPPAQPYQPTQEYQPPQQYQPPQPYRPDWQQPPAATPPVEPNPWGPPPVSPPRGAEHDPDNGDGEGDGPRQYPHP